MKSIILLSTFSALAFLIFVVALVWGIRKKNGKLKLMSLFLFFVSVVLGAGAVIVFAKKSVTKVSNALKPRSGDEIYDALLGTRETDCVKVLHYQDQVVPRIDYAIFLEFETCPQELKRILLRYPFAAKRLPSSAISKNGGTDWFLPGTLGDTVLEFTYTSEDHRNIQTIYTNTDSTKAFVEDIAD